MTKTVNVAIVGGGLMGREIAAALQRWPALIDHPVHPQLTAVCDINPAALDWFDQIPTVTRTVTDYADLLADDAIDVLYIAVRHDLHRQLYVDTIQAGKSLLAEKPFGIDGSAAEAIVATIAANPQSFVRCSSEMPFFPGVQSIWYWLRRRSFVVRLVSHRGFGALPTRRQHRVPWSQRCTDKNSRHARRIGRNRKRIERT